MISTETQKNASSKPELYTALTTGRILHLTLKRKWFEMIAKGIKTEEYREIKPYWTKRFKNFLVEQPFDYIIFKNGYAKNCPEMKVELLGIEFGESKVEWSGEEQKCYVLKLGNILYCNALM